MPTEMCIAIDRTELKTLSPSPISERSPVVFTSARSSQWSQADTALVFGIRSVFFHPRTWVNELEYGTNATRESRNMMYVPNRNRNSKIMMHTSKQHGTKANVKPSKKSKKSDSMRSNVKSLNGTLLQHANILEICKYILNIWWHVYEIVRTLLTGDIISF